MGYLALPRNYAMLEYGTNGMVGAHRRKPETFLESYCSRVWTLFKARYAGLALPAAKREAAAAKHANQWMLEVKAADLAKTRFLANMAHELRTPLNAIIRFSEIISWTPFNRKSVIRNMPNTFTMPVRYSSTSSMACSILLGYTLEA